jgi:hypothetical protein
VISENGSTAYQNFCSAANAVLKGKFIAIKAYIRKEERVQVQDA